MKKLHWFLIGALLAATIPLAATVSTLGRMELNWPDYDDPGGPGGAGAAQVAGIQTSITKIADNINARINEFSGVANSTTVTITHNFGLPVGDLSGLFYTGVGDSKSADDPVSLGYTIAGNGGDPKNKIDITTPISGGPHDFSAAYFMGYGGGAPEFEEFITLGEDLSQGEFVTAFDDGGIPKIRGVFGVYPQIAVYEDTNSVGEAQTYGTLAYTGTPGKYVYFYANGGIKSVVIDYNNGVPTYSAPAAFDSGTYPCAVWNPSKNHIVLGYENGSSQVTYKILTVAGTVLTTVDTEVTGANWRDHCKMAYNPDLGSVVVLGYHDSGTDFMGLTGVDTTANNITVSSSLDIGQLFRDGYYDMIYSKIHDRVFVTGTTTGTSDEWHSIYSMPAYGTFTLEDNYQANVFYQFVSLAEDETGGGIAFIGSDDIKPIDISGDTIVPGATVSWGHNPSGNVAPRYNDQAGVITVHHLGSGGSGTRARSTISVTPTLATILTNTGNLDVKHKYGLSNFIAGSQTTDQLIVQCYEEQNTSTLMGCDFWGGEEYLNVDSTIGVLVSPSGLSGSLGTVLLHGGITDVFTGTIGVRGYIGPTGLLTETPNGDPVGIYLDANTFQHHSGFVP